MLRGSGFRPGLGFEEWDIRPKEKAAGCKLAGSVVEGFGVQPGVRSGKAVLRCKALGLTIANWTIKPK